MKIYAACTPSHESLLNRCFLPTLDRSFEPVIIKQNIKGDGYYCKPDYMESLLQKTKAVIKSIAYNMGDIIAWSDVDVIFNITSSKLMEDFLKEDRDMVFSRLEKDNKTACFGFYVLRCNNDTLEMWKQIYSRQQRKNEGYDQAVGNCLFESKKYQYGLFDMDYAGGCMYRVIPEYFKIFHASCISGVGLKERLLKKAMIHGKFQEKNPEFARLFRGKSVCVVAGGAIKEELGQEIDNDYDIVVRLNEFAQETYPDELIKTHGRRCDVLFRECNDILRFRGGSLKQYVETIIDCGIKHVFFFDGNGNPGNACRELNAHAVAGIPSFQYIDNLIFNYLKGKIDNGNKFPTVGLVCLAAIALSEPSVIRCVGFNFYQTEITDNIYNKLLMGNDADMTAGGYHDLAKEAKVFRYYVMPMANFILDKNLNEIISKI